MALDLEKMWQILCLRMEYFEKQSLRNHGEVNQFFNVERLSSRKKEIMAPPDARRRIMHTLKDLDKSWTPKDPLFEEFASRVRDVSGATYSALVQNREKTISGILAGKKIRDHSDWVLANERIDLLIGSEGEFTKEIEKLNSAIKDYEDGTAGKRTGKRQ